jgi:transposase-like protein
MKMKLYTEVEKALKAQKKTLNWLAKELGINRMTLHNWRRQSFDVRMTRYQRAVLDKLTGAEDAGQSEIN